LARKRIYEIARELGVTSKELIAKLDEMGMPGLKASNSVDEEEHSLIVHVFRDDAAVAVESAQAEAPAKPAPKKKAGPAHGEPRPPVVSVLGHIDHGKTTLLDAIRESHLAERETGGITQGIAAYQADLAGRKITFVDTPGHKAFTGMRARGAQVTDIAVLVVAADDGVMAQTVEAIDHIKAAGVPMIVAINKIDKANADVTKVMNDLAQRGMTPEAWGGDTITVEVSALQKQNIVELLEMILLVADVEDLRGDASAALNAVVIESHLSAGRGPVATAIVKDGALREKDWIVAGSTYGRVKALMDGGGKRVSEARPGEAVEILGFDEVPPVGAPIVVAEDRADARRIAEGAKEEVSVRQARRPMTLEDLFEEPEETKRLRLVLKASTSGALEAARREIELLETETVEIDILLGGVGAISESDVILASSVSDGCLVIGFGVKADPKALKLAEHEGVGVLTYGVIYDLVDELQRVLKRAAGPEYVEAELGVAEVRDTFAVPNGVVAGCAVVEGKVTRNGRVRILRGDEEVFAGEIASLRRFRDDVREVQAGRECGIRVKDFDDFRVGDRLQVFQLEEVEP
jgi:translation initiation factor IF-2